jgi:hypothetical protein
MKFFFTFTIFTIFIISNKLFLFNEEFLILICFICFCFIIYVKLGPQVEFRFYNKTSELELSFLNSLNLLSNKLKNKKKLNDNLVSFKLLFTSLKNYYLNFSSKFIANLLIYNKNKKDNNFLTKLMLFSILEKDYSKFVTFLLINKLNQINLIFNYFSLVIKVKKFQTIRKVNRLRLIKKI